MEDAEVFAFPLTCLKTAARYLKREGVKVVVAFEFSGALLVRLLSQGVKAISVDKRAPDHDGPSFQGDFADLLGLQAWDMAFFVGPPCYQHMRHDKCLAAKIKDGKRRADGEASSAEEGELSATAGRRRPLPPCPSSHATPRTASTFDIR